MMSEDKDTTPNKGQDREAEIRQLTEEAMTLIERKRSAILEREEALEGLKEVENTFSNGHRDYEWAKQLQENAKKNQKVLRKRSMELAALIDAKEEKLLNFKKETERVIASMNRDFMTKLNAIHRENEKVVDSLRLTEIQAGGLQSQVEQKLKENEGLTQLAERLIAGTPSGPGPVTDKDADVEEEKKES